MKTTQQIIQDTHDTNPKLKEQLELYGLTLEDVGVQMIQSKEYHEQNKPIMLGYSMQDEEVVSLSVHFTVPGHEEAMREKRLEKIER